MGVTYVSDHTHKYHVYQQGFCDDASRERQPICQDIKEHDTYLTCESEEGRRAALKENTGDCWPR